VPSSSSPAEQEREREAAEAGSSAMVVGSGIRWDKGLGYRIRRIGFQYRIRASPVEGANLYVYISTT
jgi:hypothetical protein